MNKDFARILTLLRKEKKLSQKQAAEDLGISQALLSHYEKGIRECGLDFVVRAADYYHVSSDYLLGRTAERELDVSDSGEGHIGMKATYLLMSRRLIAASLDIIYDLLSRAGSRRLSRAVNAYLMTGIYRVFRTLYHANPKNASEMFTVPQVQYHGYAGATQMKLFTEIVSSCEGYTEGSAALRELNLSPDTLAKDYPGAAAALFNVIQQSENHINKLKK